MSRTYYECRECGHRVVIPQNDVVPVYCTCTSEGPLMEPLEDQEVDTE
jgi:DNA replicative helicase MCM subunit Mcm2 (Cdc46/Mcm family)